VSGTAVQSGGPAGALHTPAVAASVAAGLCAALFFNGVALQYLALTVVLLLIGAGWRLLGGYRTGLSVAHGPLPVLVTLFWIWLAVSIAWSEAWYLSFLNLWWVGAVPFVFWIALLAPDAERWWRWSFSLVLGVCAVLTVYALVQFLAWGEDARATFLNRNSFAALLNLVVLPLTASLLIPARRGATGRAAPWAGTALRALGWAFVLAAIFVVALTKSRGAILSLGLGLVLVGLVAGRGLGWRRVLVAVAVAAAALIAANLQWHGVVLERLAGLDNPTSAGATRFVIWERAWQLLLQHPFKGIGLGTFWLAYPPYRAPGDSSAGFYVHNDYLQLWIEVGLPGLLLWLGVMGAVTHQFIKVLRSSAGPATRVSAAGAFAGLLAAGVHSLFTFNLYLLPIDIVAGLLLARVQALAVASGATPANRWVPARRVTALGFRTLAILIVAIPVAHFGALALGLRAVDRARADMGEHHLVAADRALGRAETLAPGLDTTWYVHAQMLERATRLLRRPEQKAKRRQLFELALKKLARAQALNPLRPTVYKVRGDLLAQNADLAGPRAIPRAEAQYRQAIAHDPRYLLARAALAHLLGTHGRSKEAAAVLLGGLQYWQPYSHTGVRYVRFTADALSAAGDMSTRATILHRYRHWLAAAPASSRRPPGPIHKPTTGQGRSSP